MRTKICFWVLLVIPFAVYWPAITEDYGMRDDYAFMRQARSEPGRVVQFYASQGRPLGGAMIETIYSHVSSVEGLQWLRLLTVGLLAGVGLILWRQFDNSGWPVIDAAAAGLAIVLLPAAQITAAWAIGFPWVFSLILALGGFAAIEMELEKGGLKRTMGVIGGILIYMMSIFIYQSNVVFAVVPIAAAVLPKAGRRTKSELLRWLVLHLLVLLIALVLSYLMLRVLLADPVFKGSAQMGFERNPFTKLLWLLWHPVPNALALFVLRDDFFTVRAIFFWLAAAGMLAFLVWIVRKEPVKADGIDRLKWWICLAILPWVAILISLIAGERSRGYRTLYALSGLVVVAAFTGLRRLPLPKHIEPLVHYGVMGVVLLGAAFFAEQHTVRLIAVPQSLEWGIIRDAVAQDQLKDKVVTRFFLIEPSLADRTTRLVHADEFGSLSSDTDKYSREMFNIAVRERYPDGLPTGQSVELKQGKQAPAEASCDFVIDMRKLEHFRE